MGSRSPNRRANDSGELRPTDLIVADRHQILARIKRTILLHRNLRGGYEETRFQAKRQAS